MALRESQLLKASLARKPAAGEFPEDWLQPKNLSFRTIKGKFTTWIKNDSEDHEAREASASASAEEQVGGGAPTTARKPTTAPTFTVTTDPNPFGDSPSGSARASGSGNNGNAGTPRTGAEEHNLVPRLPTQSLPMRPPQQPDQDTNALWPGTFFGRGLSLFGNTTAAPGAGQGAGVGPDSLLPANFASSAPGAYPVALDNGDQHRSQGGAGVDNNPGSGNNGRGPGNNSGGSGNGGPPMSNDASMSKEQAQDWYDWWYIKHMERAVEDARRRATQLRLEARKFDDEAERLGAEARDKWGAWEQRK